MIATQTQSSPAKPSRSLQARMRRIAKQDTRILLESEILPRQDLLLQLLYQRAGVQNTETLGGLDQFVGFSFQSARIFAEGFWHLLERQERDDIFRYGHNDTDSRDMRQLLQYGGLIAQKIKTHYGEFFPQDAADAANADGIFPEFAAPEFSAENYNQFMRDLALAHVAQLRKRAGVQLQTIIRRARATQKSV